MHSFKTRIYYEDTDAGGRVYYANYLKYMERARTELLREIGFESGDALVQGFGFVVADLSIKFRGPAALDDEVEVQTRVKEARKIRLILEQNILNNAKMLTESVITLSYIDSNGRPVKIPDGLLEKLM